MFHIHLYYMHCVQEIAVKYIYIKTKKKKKALAKLKNNNIDEELIARQSPLLELIYYLQLLKLFCSRNHC